VAPPPDHPTRIGLVALILLVGACAAPSPSPITSASAAPESREPSSAAASPVPTPAEHRIGVRVVNGDGEFFDRTTGERFVARGANLIRLDTYHNTFNPGAYDAADLDAQLSAMAALGYNVVRVFLDQRPGGMGGGSTAGISARYMDNVAAFLRLAKQHSVFVMFTQDWLPDGDRYAAGATPLIEGNNAGYLAPSGVRANARFFGDFVDELVDRGAPLDAIWAYELRNELFFDATEAPFSLASGSVTTASGQTYDLADESQRRPLMEDGVVYWTNQVRAEILRHDPTALVAVGFFVPQGPNVARPGDTRLIETRQEILVSEADFIDLHGYPGADLPLPKHLENFGLPPVSTKPIVMGEMGAFRNLFSTPAEAVPSLISWQADSCARGFDGWLIWTWDSGGDPTGVWNATDAGGVLADALAPAERGDPCSSQGGKPVNLALDQPVLASFERAVDGPASAAVDGALHNIWNAGDFAPQWIEVDLGAAVTGASVRLVVAQSPAGRTEHLVYGTPVAGGPLTLLHTFIGDTADGDVLSFVLGDEDPALRILRIETVGSPSWVAWREIEVYAPA